MTDFEREKAIKKLLKSGIKYVPRRIFHLNFIPRVVIIGQDPYPGICNITKIPYACEYAFLVDDRVLSCPVSLRNLFIELKNDIGCSKNISLAQIKRRTKSWINQGVCFTNVALTRGIESNYLDDHKTLWKSYTIEFIKQIDCPVVLLGKDAWELSKFISQDIAIFKFHHPVSRNGEFFDCKMFSRINSVIYPPIKW